MSLYIAPPPGEYKAPAAAPFPSGSGPCCVFDCTPGVFESGSGNTCGFELGTSGCGWFGSGSGSGWGRGCGFGFGFGFGSG